MVIDKVGSNRTVTHLLPPEVRRIAPRPTFDPGQSGISGAHDARMFMVGPPVVPGVQVLGKKGELRFIPEDVVAHGLNTNYFLCRTEASESSQIYVISKEIFKDHLTQIFNHSVYDSTLRLDKLSKPGEKDLFIAARDVAMANTTTPEKLFYYSFMINEATNEGIDYLSAAATMLTDLPDSAVRQFTASLPAKAKDQAKEISTILQRFNRLEKTRYLPPQGRQNNLIQNHMDALICIAQGDGRAVLMRLLHRLSRLKMINKASAAQIKSTREIYAPFAERFGLYHIALELQENAFRVEQEIECAANAEHKNKYIASENEIMWTLGFTDRPEAEAYLAELTARFAHANPNAEVDGRVKGAWSAYAKLEYKPDEYPDILYMVDLMGERAIEDGPLCSMKDAQARVQATLGNNFKDFNYENNQTETRTMEIDGITIKYHYVSAITKDDKAIEFQFITKEDFKILTFGQKDTWLHLKDRPSAHVIIVSDKQNLPHDIIYEAAKLCAEFSVYEKGRYLVDYTPRREVKMQEGANVLYNKYNTIEVAL